MRKQVFISILLALAVLALAAGLFYRVSAVHSRLSWRVDFALAYLRGVIDPVEAPPTALPIPKITATNDPTRTSTAPPVASQTPTAENTPTPLPSPTPLPGSVSLDSPAYEKQDINNCGPASLSMYMRFYGWEGDQAVIAQVLKPFREDRNVNVDEMAYYVRTHAGWLNAEFRVGGNLELIKEFLAAGIPVMIEESFYFADPYWPNDDLWAAHYYLVTGYDDSTETFTGQDSFHGPDRTVSYETLDEYWQAFNRVYMLVYLPNQEETVKDILGPHWDPDTNRQQALDTALAETEADPNDAFAWFNLGANLTYFERYIEATEAYDKARELELPQRMLRYQFGPFIAYFHTGQTEELLALTEYALKITPNAEEAKLWRGWAMYRLGRTNEALDYFNQALAENPNYLDAQYALDFVSANP